MFGSPRIKLDPQLLGRVRRCVERVGYSSVDEFITHAVERAVAEIEDAPDEQELKRRLKGLGYLS
jgi:Arc/MetJ-type ribon-helix-helix transcriptional regulator